MQALIVVDMQRWMFRLPEREAQLATIVPTINKLATDFAAADRPVFDVRVVHKIDRSTWSRLMLKYDYPCLIEGTADAEAVDGLAIPSAARSIFKRSNSAFFETDLGEQLRALKVERVILAGAFIDGCVGLTAADAAQRGFDVTLVEDGIAHRNEGHGATLIEWLVSMYELTTMKADAVSATL
jgi:nicotinamidase-related amidase